MQLNSLYPPSRETGYSAADMSHEELRLRNFQEYTVVRQPKIYQSNPMSAQGKSDLKKNQSATEDRPEMDTSPIRSPNLEMAECTQGSV